MLIGTTNEQKIWNYLVAHGLTAAGAAGLMGNMYAESGLLANNLQNTGNKKLGMTDAEYTSAVDKGTYTNFVKDSQGYGLCQWTFYTRKQALLNFAKAAGKSIGDLEMQLDFLMKELSESYKDVLTTLKTATNVKAASDVVLLKFERPANQGDAVKNTRAGYGQNYYSRYSTMSNGNTSSSNNSTDLKGDKMDFTKKITTAAELAARAEYIAKNFKTLYVMGCFGAPMTASNKTRYCNNHSYNKAATRQAMIKAASTDTFGFDCVCLIKGLLWGWTGDVSKAYGGAIYASNGVPDTNADGMIKLCKNVSTDFSKIEVGEAVWMSGHIGIYIGNGLAVECTPAWKNKVQITAVGNIGSKSGYNTRKWTKHGKLPYVTYGGTTSTPSTSTGSTSSSTTTSTTKPSTPSTSTGSTSSNKVTEKKAKGVAKKLDTKLAGTYVVTASNLHIRDDAKSTSTSLALIPKGTKVSNYGYYSLNGTAKWLYIQVTYNGVKYTGFCSASWLKKQ